MARTAKSTKQDLTDRAWHADSAEEAGEALGSDPESGLTDKEAEQRRERFGCTP
jgi:hypothetical protein